MRVNHNDLLTDNLPLPETGTNDQKAATEKVKKPKARKPRKPKYDPLLYKQRDTKAKASTKPKAKPATDSQNTVEECPMILPHQRQQEATPTPTPEGIINGATDLNADIKPKPTPPPPDNYPTLEQRSCYRCYSKVWHNPDGKRQPPGVYSHSISKGKEPQPVDTWICGEMHIDAKARDKHDRNFGRVLRFKNEDKKWQTWNMPKRLLAGRGDKILEELLEMGLAVNYPIRGAIASYINSVTPKKTIWTAAQVGWFDDCKNFVLPNEVIGEDAHNVMFQAESNCLKEYSTKGTLDAWRGEVAALCVGNPLLMLAVSTAFAGSLLKPCNMDSAGFHIFGDSTSGKSSGLKLAASVWGDWKEYKRAWKATANGLEGAAALFNDGLLTLDEMGDGDANDISEALYLLANGTGKQRANVLGHARAVNTWRVAVLSNGEHTIEAHLAKKGLTVKAGQLMRFLQIPIFGKYRSFDDLHGQTEGGAFADTITKHAGRWYGAAGRAWLGKLTQDSEVLSDCSNHLNEAMAWFTTQLGELSAQEARAAKAFALVGMAGDMATHYGITGWPDGAAMDAALVCFKHWRGHRGAGDIEPQQIKDAITAYTEQWGDARFTSTLDDIRLYGERSGYWRDTDKGREWLFTKAGLMQATKGFDLKQVVSVLKACGWLQLDGQGKSTKTALFKSNETNEKRFYVVIVINSGVSGVSGVSQLILNEKNANTSLTPKPKGVSVDNEILMDANTDNTFKILGVSEKHVINHDSNTANTANTEKNSNATQVGDWGII